MCSLNWTAGIVMEDIGMVDISTCSLPNQMQNFELELELQVRRSEKNVQSASPLGLE
jgi:hypothetical protein